LADTVGLNFSIIAGYPGGAEQDLALERGEVHCRAITIAAFFGREPFRSWYRNGFVRVLLQTRRQRDSKLADVPTIYELMDQNKTPDNKRRLIAAYFGAGGFGAWPLVASPEIPPDRVKILRAAFPKMMKEPEFLEEAKKKNWEINPVSGEELEALAKDVVNQPQEVKDWLKRLFAK
jgi:tripartite-type tricarboxylate transporter receptor subunit TctC